MIYNTNLNDINEATLTYIATSYNTIYTVTKYTATTSKIISKENNVPFKKLECHN